MTNVSLMHRQKRIVVDGKRKQNSPQNLAQRQAFAMKFGRLAGEMGGKDKVRPTILNYLQAQHKAREYVPGANYVEAPRAGGGGWNLGLGIADALSYLDTSKLGGNKGRTPTYNPGAS